MATKTIEAFKEEYDKYEKTSSLNFFEFAKVSTTIKKRLDNKLEDPFVFYAKLLEEIQRQ
jgi:hypothetical protein